MRTQQPHEHCYTPSINATCNLQERNNSAELILSKLQEGRSVPCPNDIMSSRCNIASPSRLHARLGCSRRTPSEPELTSDASLAEVFPWHTGRPIFASNPSPHSA